MRELPPRVICLEDEITTKQYLFPTHQCGCSYQRSGQTARFYSLANIVEWLNVL